MANEKRFWTESDEDFLKQNYGSLTINELANRFGRTPIQMLEYLR